MTDSKISENIEEYLEVLYRNGSNGKLSCHICLTILDIIIY